MALERAVLDASSSESEDGRIDELQFIPRTANTDAGLRMELQLAKELRDREYDDTNDSYCIVDQTQFRNTEVGKGYQHKSVVRQRVAEDPATLHKVIDMRLKSNNKHAEDQNSQKRIHTNHKGKRKHEKKRKKGRLSSLERDSDSESRMSIEPIIPSLEMAKPALQELMDLLELELRSRTE